MHVTKLWCDVKIIVSARMSTQKDSLHVFSQGSCLEMCSSQELELREREGLLHVLEVMRGTEKNRRPKADRRKVVKEYSRSAAGQDMTRPSELRPLETLKRTVKYLLDEAGASNLLLRWLANLCMNCFSVSHTSSLSNWVIVYNFVSDRLRAVRQDLTVQGLTGEDVLPVLEPMVLFHAYAAYKLCDCPIAVFDQKMNNDLLLDCLKRVLVLYDNGARSTRRGLLESMYAMVGLGQPETLCRLSSLPPHHRSEETILAYNVAAALQLGNYARGCRLLASLPAPLACAAAQHLPSVRRRALTVMSSAYHSSTLMVPGCVLARILLFSSSEDALAECLHYGLACSQDGVKFQRGSINTHSKNAPHTKLKFLEDVLEEWWKNVEKVNQET